jgi:hypothetical protein
VCPASLTPKRSITLDLGCCLFRLRIMAGSFLLLPPPHGGMEFLSCHNPARFARASRCRSVRLPTLRRLFPFVAHTGEHLFKANVGSAALLPSDNAAVLVALGPLHGDVLTRAAEQSSKKRTQNDESAT